MTVARQQPSDWVSQDEAAHRLNVTKKTIRKWCKLGRLEKHRKSYRVALISVASIESAKKWAKALQTLREKPEAQ